jgi:hypothetical protein
MQRSERLADEFGFAQASTGYRYQNQQSVSVSAISRDGRGGTIKPAIRTSAARTCLIPLSALVFVDMADNVKWTGIRQHPKRSGSLAGSARIRAEGRSGGTLFVMVVFLVILLAFAAQVLVGSGGWGRLSPPTAGTPGEIPAIHLVSMNAGAPPGYGLTNRNALQAHAPIHIDGNTSFTAANGVRSGSGTKADPYIISDWLIDMTNFPNASAGVWIQHASKYTIVRNIEIKNINGVGNFFGILLGTSFYPPVSTDWAENITVTHVLVHNMSLGYGIESAYYTKNNNISFSAVYMNITSRDWQYGITCQGGSQNCVIWGNYVDARVANAQASLRTVGIQSGDGCLVDWGIGFVLPCATVTVAYNTVSNATSEGFVSDGTTHSSFFNNLAYQNYPGRKQITGTSRGIMVESRSNYTSVHDNVFYNYNNGIEVGAWGGWYWNNAVHDNDWGIVVDANNSFLNVGFAIFNTIWNTAYYNNANGNFNIPAGQYTVLLDGQPGVTPTNFPFQFVNQGAQTISGAGYLWAGKDVTAWYDLTAWGYMKAVTIYDHQVSSLSQNLSGSWSGSKLGLTVSRFTASDIVYTITSATGAGFRGSGLTEAAYYQVYRTGNLLSTVPTTMAGGLSFVMPAPASGSYEVRFSSTVPLPTVSISAPVNGAYVTSSSLPLSWSLTDPGPGLQSVLLSVDGGAAVNVTGQGSYTLGGLADGRHVVTITATDLTGLNGNASVVVVVDTHPPVLNILTPVNRATLTATSILLTWSATDATSGINHLDVSLDNGPAVAATGSNYSFGGLALGTHQVSVTAVDNAGLSTTSTITFNISTTSPNPPGNATQPPGNATNSTTPSTTPAVMSVAYLPNASAVDIVFTQPMNQTSVNKSIAVSPGIDYSLQWVNESHVRVVLHSSLSTGSMYQVVLQPSAKTTSGTNLQHPFAFQFLAPVSGSPATAVATTWLPFFIIVIALLLVVNWATAGYLIVHYRQNAKRVKSTLNRFTKRYAGSMIVVYKKLALGTRRTRKADRKVVPKTPVRKVVPKAPVRKVAPKGPVTKVRKVVRKTAEPVTPRWKPPGGHH